MPAMAGFGGDADDSSTVLALGADLSAVVDDATAGVTIA